MLSYNSKNFTSPTVLVNMRVCYPSYCIIEICNVKFNWNAKKCIGNLICQVIWAVWTLWKEPLLPLRLFSTNWFSFPLSSALVLKLKKKKKPVKFESNFIKELLLKMSHNWKVQFPQTVFLSFALRFVLLEAEFETTYGFRVRRIMDRDHQRKR